MSSEETCSQGFPNDDIFEVIEFAFMQMKAAGLRYQRTITVGAKRPWQSRRKPHFQIFRNSHSVRISLRQRRNITFGASQKYHSRIARISLPNIKCRDYDILFAFMIFAIVKMT